ncbi:hypothetical protein BXY66_3866 [Shimia isoporae]|uniref:Uncharacterized protein n=1 Tax=Shimia isoporae TaxID=647720 RepID=A0A4R1N0Y5_9RHOB|nr:hypothetical protein [Shimia isoporae]TCK99364.1 hypothetical protein BXY66_3866 [Shimia isoporae]
MTATELLTHLPARFATQEPIVKSQTAPLALNDAFDLASAQTQLRLLDDGMDGPAVADLIAKTTSRKERHLSHLMRQGAHAFVAHSHSGAIDQADLEGLRKSTDRVVAATEEHAQNFLIGCMGLRHMVLSGAGPFSPEQANDIRKATMLVEVDNLLVMADSEIPTAFDHVDLQKVSDLAMVKIIKATNVGRAKAALKRAENGLADTMDRMGLITKRLETLAEQEISENKTIAAAEIAFGKYSVENMRLEMADCEHDHDRLQDIISDRRDALLDALEADKATKQASDTARQNFINWAKGD